MCMQRERDCAIQIPEQFNGPPASAQGGYLCGRLAALLAARQAVVTLLLPPPLGVELETRRTGDRITLWDADRLLATAVAGGSRPATEPLDLAAADQLTGAFAGFTRHPFPTCFVCGTDRPDGMRIFPAPVPGRPGTVAAAWTPAAELCDSDGLVHPEFVWAALDCPGGWSAMSAEEAASAGEPQTLVLARMALELTGRPRCGERHLVLGRLDRQSGRTAWVRTALFDSAGATLATSVAQWLSVDPASFAPAGGDPARGTPASVAPAGGDPAGMEGTG